MTSIEEHTANHEIISALVISVGMISLIMNELAGYLFILAGVGSLVIIYGYRIYAISPYSVNGGLPGSISRLNYLVLIMGLLLMVVMVVSQRGHLVYLIAGAGMMAVLTFVNIYSCKRRYQRIGLFQCQLRIALILMLMLLFYFFPVR